MAQGLLCHKTANNGINRPRHSDLCIESEESLYQYSADSTTNGNNIQITSPPPIKNPLSTVYELSGLGFGDIAPVKVGSSLAAEILVTLEVILGYIGLGGLISILANKVARRA